MHPLLTDSLDPQIVSLIQGVEYHSVIIADISLRDEKNRRYQLTNMFRNTLKTAPPLIAVVAMRHLPGRSGQDLDRRVVDPVLPEQHLLS